MPHPLLCILFASPLAILQGWMTSALEHDTPVTASSTPSPLSLISSSTEQLVEVLRKEEAAFTQAGKKRPKSCHTVDGKRTRSASTDAGEKSRRLAEEADESFPDVQIYPIRILIPSLVLDSPDHKELTQKLRDSVNRLCGRIGPVAPFGGTKILLPSETENKQIAEILDTIKREGQDIEGRKEAWWLPQRDVQLQTLIYASRDLRDCVCQGLEPEPDFAVELAGKVKPDDPLFSDLWGFEEVNLASAWELENTGELKLEARPIVCVSDSGVDYTHEDLYENIFINEAEALGVPQVDDDNNGYVDDIYGINVHDQSQLNNPMDASAHGTHVAGTLGAIGNNTKGVCGVAWRPRIIPCKFIGKSPGSISGAVECIAYCISRGAKVSVHSYSFSTYSETLQVVMFWAETQGLLMAYASGNAGVDTGVQPWYPGCYASKLAGALAVANVQRVRGSGSLVLNPRSNYGSCIHFGCPGTNIVSTISRHQPRPYGTMNGSSMAAALMAGIITLMVAVKPDLSPAECRRFVQGCIIRLPSLRNTVEWQGMPDAHCCVRAAANGSALQRVSQWTTFAASGVGLAVAVLGGDL